MKTIKIDVVDLWPGADKNKVWIVELLKRYYHIEFSEKPDFLFFSCYSNDFLKYDNCVKIFFTGENVVPNFNYCDYAIGFATLDFGNRYFRRYNSMISQSIQDRSNVTKELLNRRFCNFVYSNASDGKLVQLRQDFCKKLMEYKNVDCPGAVLHNMDTDELEPRNGDWRESKKEFLKKYKFTIAFENSFSNGYTTEKLIHPLKSFSVPIYYGNPEVVRDFNPKSFINCNDYNNDFDAIIERIKYLDTHDDEYLAMLREPPMQPNVDFEDTRFIKWLCSVIDNPKIFDKGPRPDWEYGSYKNNFYKLNIENENLKSQINQDKEVLNRINQINSDLQSVIVKQRKYLNLLFVAQFVWLFVLLFLLFAF